MTLQLTKPCLDYTRHVGCGHVSAVMVELDVDNRVLEIRDTHDDFAIGDVPQVKCVVLSARSNQRLICFGLNVDAEYGL